MNGRAVPSLGRFRPIRGCSAPCRSSSMSSGGLSRPVCICVNSCWLPPVFGFGLIGSQSWPGHHQRAAGCYSQLVVQPAGRQINHTCCQRVHRTLRHARTVTRNNVRRATQLSVPAANQRSGDSLNEPAGSRYWSIFQTTRQLAPSSRAWCKRCGRCRDHCSDP